MNRQSSRHRYSSDDNGEAADFSPSLFRKEMLERKYDDDDDDDGAFSQTDSEGPPEPESSSSGDDIQDHQDRKDFSLVFFIFNNFGRFIHKVTFSSITQNT